MNEFLTKDEKSWLNKLQKVLDTCPSKRLGAFVTGDTTLHIFDKTHFQYKERNGEFCQQVEACGAMLFTVNFPFQIEATAG